MKSSTNEYDKKKTVYHRTINWVKSR